MEQEFNLEDLKEIVVEPDDDGCVGIKEIINLFQDA